MIIAILICSFLHFVKGTPVISLYADVFKDKDFFITTFPWIIDNIGGEIMVDYYLLGSGRYSVPQMCALNELKNNAFLQAEYLKCEAEGYPSAYCLCETGIDPERFKDCVRDKGTLASFASSMFTRLNIDTTPLIELAPKVTIFEVSDNWYLKKICTIFGDNPPLGCIKPFSCCGNGTEVADTKKSIAHFDKECCPYLGHNCYPSAPSTTTTNDYDNNWTTAAAQQHESYKMVALQ